VVAGVVRGQLELDLAVPARQRHLERPDGMLQSVGGDVSDQVFEVFRRGFEGERAVHIAFLDEGDGGHADVRAGVDHRSQAIRRSAVPEPAHQRHGAADLVRLVAAHHVEILADEPLPAAESEAAVECFDGDVVPRGNVSKPPECPAQKVIGYHPA